MALGGTLNTSKYDGRYYQLVWEATQNVSKNQSTIKWTLKAVGGNSSWYAERTLKVVIDGETVVSKTARVERYPMVITSGEKVITHNNDGKRSFKASISAAVYTSSVNCTGSSTFTLDAIPRKANITSAPDFNDEANPVLNYSNPFGNGVNTLQACISLTGSKDDIAYRNISKTGTSYTFNLTDAERNVLRNATKTSNSRTVHFYIKTIIGGTTFYSKVAKTLTIVNANPTINTASAVDVGTASTVLTGNTSSIIKGHNYISCSMTTSALKGATIKSFKITNGKSVINAASGSFTNATDGKIVFEAIDTRGNKATKTINLSVINYNKLTCNVDGKIVLNSADSTKADLTFTVSGNYFNGSFGAVANTLSLVYELEDSSGGWRSEVIDIPADAISNGSYTVSKTIEGLDYQNSYKVIVNASDKIYANVKSTSKAFKAIPLFDWGENDFNFNVPVNYTDGAGTFNLSGAAKALTTAYTLTTTVAKGSNYSEASGSALLIGNNLRCHIAATRSSAASGNIANEDVCTVTIKHGGKIKSSYNVTFGNGATGNLASLYMSDATNDGDTLTFIARLAATTETAGISTYFSIPCTLNLDAY